MPNFRKKSLSLATAIAGVLTFGSMIGCSGTDNDDPQPLGSGSPTVSGTVGGNQVTFVGRNNSDVNPLYEMYRGIHYGESTAGANRFEPPVPKELSGTVDATAAGPGCPQPASSYGAYSDNEDCLVLNVYKPVTAPPEGESYPVMLWIHGGAFIYGSGTESGYNPQDLVSKGMVVVTINYRLGALGFLTHADGIEGNFGLMDQQLAMEWVRDNIELFDGDSDNITVFGESAGGHSVLSHLAAPSSSEFFDKAIVQSGSYLGHQVHVSIAQGLGAAFAARPSVSCSSASCLRDLPVSTILANQSASGYVPTWGTDFLPSSINAAMAANTKPVMLGSNVNEGALFAYLDVMTKTSAYPNDFVTNTQYKAAVAKLLENYVVDGSLLNVDTDAVAAQQVNWIFSAFTSGAFTNGDDWDEHASMQPNPLIPGNETSTRKLGTLVYSLAYSNIYTNSFFACPANDQLDRLVSDESAPNVYAFEFRDRQSPYSLKNILPRNPLIKELDPTYIPPVGEEPEDHDRNNDPVRVPFIGATHTTEIQYLFGNTAIRTTAGMSANQRTLAGHMMNYWTNFAKSGNPNLPAVEGLPAWNSYNAASAILNLDDATTGGITTSNAAAFRHPHPLVGHGCAYWEGTGLPLVVAPSSVE